MCPNWYCSVQKLLNMLYNEEWTRPPPKYLLSAPKVAEGRGFAMPAGQAVKQTGFMEGVKSLASQVGLTGRQRQVEFDEDYVGLKSVPFNTTQQQGVAVGSATPSVGIGVIQTQELEGHGASYTTPHLLVLGGIRSTHSSVI